MGKEILYQLESLRAFIKSRGHLSVGPGGVKVVRLRMLLIQKAGIQQYSHEVETPITPLDLDHNTHRT
jgi:hypothetical protein